MDGAGGAGRRAAGLSANSGRISQQELGKYFGMLNHESKNNRGFRNFSLKATKKGKLLLSFIFRLPIEVRMSGDSPPGFTLVTLKKRSSKVATGTEEGQSLGKAKSSGLEQEGPSSRPENFGKVKNRSEDEQGSTPRFHPGHLEGKVFQGGEIGDGKGHGGRAIP